MGVGGLCPKRASAQIRCKCTKKNGAGDVSTSFFETLLCTPSLHAHFFPHYPGKSPIFSSKTRNHRTQLPNLRRPLRRRRVHPFDLPVVSGRDVHATVKTLSRATRITHTTAGFRFLPSRLHAFTHPSQAAHSQIIKCEDFYIGHLHSPSPPFRSIVSARRHVASRTHGSSHRQETAVKVSHPKPSPLFAWITTSYDTRVKE